MWYYRKTPLISTYVFLGLASVQVLIFGGCTYFPGCDKAGCKILQGRMLFSPVLSVDNTLLRMFQLILPGYGGTYIWGYVLSGHCSRQQISVKNEGVLIFGGVPIYGVLRY